MKILFRLPPAHQPLLSEPELHVMPGRVCEIRYSYQRDETGREGRHIIAFLDVVAFKLTYLPAMSAEMFDTAYCRVVDLGDSAWLKEIMSVRVANSSPIMHVRLTLDDGPCYEFICGGVRLPDES